MSRKLNDKLKGQSVVGSQIMKWILLGTPIEDIPKWEWSYAQTEINEIRDFLCYVDDDELTEAVIASYKLSVAAHHLVYSEEANLPYYKRSRYRVLLRMVWYGI